MRELVGKGYSDSTILKIFENLFKSKVKSPQIPNSYQNLFKSLLQNLPQIPTSNSLQKPSQNRSKFPQFHPNSLLHNKLHRLADVTFFSNSLSLSFRHSRIKKKSLKGEEGIFNKKKRPSRKKNRTRSRKTGRG